MRANNELGMSLLHQPYEPFAYARSQTSARIVLLAEPGFVVRVIVHYGDRYHPELVSQVEMQSGGCGLRSEYFYADLDVPTRRLKYAFEVFPKKGKKSIWYGEQGISFEFEQAGVFQLAYLTDRDLFRVPNWVNQAVCYQIFPERFANGKKALTPSGAVRWNTRPTSTSMHGGDLPGITMHLADLQQLGVNVLYLTPIFQAPSNHKYDTTDYFSIDSQFGSKADLQHLVKSAHQRGIRVILDAVLNHCGFQFAPFQDVVEKGKQSRYYDWFFIEGDTIDTKLVNYETFADKIASMPKLNVANPEAAAYLLSVAAYWIRECDIDGWRLDVANEIDHVFWRRFRLAVKALKPDALIIGEVWHNSLPWLRGDEFDGVMNYVFRNRMLETFVQKDTSMHTFGRALTDLIYQYPEPAIRSIFNLLGSHDTERILTLAQQTARVEQMFAVQFTYPGIPMVYYGDEIGMRGDKDPDCRRGMIWDEKKQDLRLKASVMALAQLRQREKALSASNFLVIKTEQAAIEYRRWDELSREALHIAVNLGPEPFVLSSDGDVVFSAGDPVQAGRVLSAGSTVIWRPKDNGLDKQR